MPSKTSRKPRIKRDSKKSPKKSSTPNRQDEVKADVLEKALSELMDMSDDELTETLSSMSLDQPPNSKQTVRAAPENKPEAAEKESADELNETAEDRSEMVEDPTTLSLVQTGIVNIAQVSEALKEKEGDGELWRTLAKVDGVNGEAVFAAVAKASGVSFYTYLDAAPTRELVNELISFLTAEKLEDLLNHGLLPVDLEPSSDESTNKLLLVTHDPTNASISDYLKSNEIEGGCLFAPLSQVAERIDIVRGWLTSSSPFGLGSALGSGVDEKSDDASDESWDDIHVGEFDAKATDSQESDSDSNNGMESEDEQEETLQTTPESEDFLTDYLIEGDGIPLYIDDSHDANGDHDPADIVTIPSNGDEGEPPSLLTPASHDRVIRSLLGSGHVSEKQVQQAIADWQAGNGREALWRILGDQPEVNKEAVYEEAARVYAFKQEQIGNGRPDFDFVLLTMQTVAEDQREELLDLLLLPFEHVVDYETGVGRMIFVTPDPTHPEVSRLLHELDLGRFELKYAPESEIRALLEELFPRKNEYLERISTEDTAFDFGTSYEDSADLVDEEALDAEIKRSKLINLFEATLVEATRMGASDIHIYPNPKRQVEIHFRLDGRLKHWHTEQGIAPEAFLSVVKDNSTNVDRFERDAAQDGYIQRRIDDALIRFRVSILPIATANQELRAESIVIRILDDRKVLTELDQLGMLDVALERFDKAIRQPHGMVILTGPTGSGKSTTLVAALYQVVTSEVNVLSVEDPVEYIINGVRQIKLSHKLNLESALRSILRHDPDIVMVGEMRDHETAELAIKLANTGHLTFSTLHTNDAPAAVSRLYKMGVEPFLIAYAINLVVAQRLIRSVCPTCKAEDKSPDKVLMKSLGWTDKEIEETTVYKAMRGGNCATCSGIGYKGRRAICETLYFSDKIRQLIAEAGTDIDEGAIRKTGIEEGMLTLMESAKRLVEMGETTLDEMLRTTGAE